MAPVVSLARCYILNNYTVYFINDLSRYYILLDCER